MIELAFALLIAAEKPIARWEGGGDSLELYATQGDCPDNTRRAVYTMRPPRTYTIEGCYVVIEERVFVGFADGDRFHMPQKVFKWVKGQEPPTL